MPTRLRPTSSVAAEAILVGDPGRARLLAVAEAHAWSSGGAGEPMRPDPELAESLRRRLGEDAQTGAVASLDTLHGGGAPAPVEAGDAADMQTASLFSRAQTLEVAMAAVLIVTESAGGEALGDVEAEAAAKQAGTAAAASL